MGMDKTKDLRSLYKDLYNVCRRRVHPDWQHDPEAVRALRDYTTIERFGKTYDKMNVEELQELIKELSDSGEQKEYATEKMLNMLKYYAISVAIIYANMAEWEYCDTASGATLSGNDLREFLKYNFYRNGHTIPTYLIRRLFEEWINPHSNQFLIEGKYRKAVKNPQTMYYERLSKQEVRYLLNRYSAIYNQILNKNIINNGESHFLKQIRSN